MGQEWQVGVYPGGAVGHRGTRRERDITSHPALHTQPYPPAALGQLLVIGSSRPLVPPPARERNCGQWKARMGEGAVPVSGPAPSRQQLVELDPADRFNACVSVRCGGGRFGLPGRTRWCSARRKWPEGA